MSEQIMHEGIMHNEDYVAFEHDGGYIIKDVTITGISEDLLEQTYRRAKGHPDNDNLGELTLVLFEDNGRYDLGLFAKDSTEVVWVLKDFRLPQGITSDKSFFAGMLTFWLTQRREDSLRMVLTDMLESDVFQRMRFAEIMEYIKCLPASVQRHVQADVMDLLEKKYRLPVEAVADDTEDAE